MDILPAQPPRGVSTIQGDFLSPSVQAEVRAYVLDPERGRPRKDTFSNTDDADAEDVQDIWTEHGGEAASVDQPGYIEMERSMDNESPASGSDLSQPSEAADRADTQGMTRKQREQAMGRVVDVVLSDMSEPWDQTAGFGSRSISNPYIRMMNTTGVSFKDHVGSMVCPCIDNVA